LCRGAYYFINVIINQKQPYVNGVKAINVKKLKYFLGYITLDNNHIDMDIISAYKLNMLFCNKKDIKLLPNAFNNNINAKINNSKKNRIFNS
jgi:hypothetical protein